MYGSPLATGYGSVDAMMAAGHVLPNLRRYVGVADGSHTPFLLLALAAPAIVRHPRQAWLCLAVAATTLACYLPYRVFDDWWYTRFLLPAIPLLIVLSAATLVATRRAPGASAVRVSVTVACVMMLMAFWIPDRTRRHAFDLAEMEQHYCSRRNGDRGARHGPGGDRHAEEQRQRAVSHRTIHAVVGHTRAGIVGPGARLCPGSRRHAVSAAGNRRGIGVPRSFPRRQRPRQSRLASAHPGGTNDSPLRPPRSRRSFSKTARCGRQFIRDAPVPSRDWRRWIGVR